MKIAERTGPALRMLRRRAGMTQREVAETAGISKNLVSNWETGSTGPSLNSLDKVLGVMGANLLDLHNTMRLLQGLPAETPSPSAAAGASGLAVGRLPVDREDRQAQLLARAPEVVLWVLELLRTIQPSPWDER